MTRGVYQVKHSKDDRPDTYRRIGVTADRHLRNILTDRQMFAAHGRHHMQVEQISDLVVVTLGAKYNVSDRRYGHNDFVLEGDSPVVAPLRAG